MPLWILRFLYSQCDGGILICWCFFKNTAVACYDGHEKKHPSEIAKIRDCPGDCYIQEGNASMEEGGDHELYDALGQPAGN